MIHRYYNNGYYIVLDVNSGAVHVVDELAYEVIGLVDEACQPDEIVAKLKDRWPESDIREVLEDVEELTRQGVLFTEDTYKDKIIDFKKRSTVVKALCLHIAHGCNLACRYCFADLLAVYRIVTAVIAVRSVIYDLVPELFQLFFDLLFHFYCCMIISDCDFHFLSS